MVIIQPEEDVERYSMADADICQVEDSKGLRVVELERQVMPE